PFLAECRAQGGKAKAVTMAAIEEAWKARAARVKGLRIKWKEKRHNPRGIESDWWNSLAPEMAKDNNPTGAVVPPKDTELEVVCLLVFDGERVRFHNAIPRWSLAKGAY